MKTLLEILREPLVISAFVVALFFVVGAHVVSNWYYGKVELPPSSMETYVSEWTDNTPPGADIDLSDLTSTSAKLDSTQSNDLEDKPLTSESDSYELTPEDEALLLEHFAETLPPPRRESPHGLGPYPDIPPDYPRQNIWDDLEDLNENNPFGRSSIDHELMHRVLIKLWNQGKKAEGAVLDSDNGRVYPMYKDTVYINWSEDENEDGSVDRYIGRYRCHPSLKDYRDSVENGTQPSWLKVVAMADGGINPYSFLDLR